VAEANALTRETVEVRGVVVERAVTSQVTPAKVIGEDENDIWPLRDGASLRDEGRLSPDPVSTVLNSSLVVLATNR
jgi:hypothetical protein